MVQGIVELSYKYQPLFECLEDDSIRYVLIEGGRGSGKSVALSTFLNHLTFDKGNKILFTRYTMVSAQTSIIPEFREKCEWLGNDDSFRFMANEVINNDTGVEILYRGLKPSSATANSALKSVNNVNVFVLEEAQECADEELFDRVDFSIRTKNKKNLVIIVLNPTDQNHWIFKRFFGEKGDERRDDTLYIKSSYLDNLPNLDDSFIKRAEEIKEKNQRKFANVFMGEWLKDVDGALWSFQMLHDAKKVPNLGDHERIVVALDPAVTSNENSSETGIVVAGKTSTGRYVVLEDASGIYSPLEWGSKAIHLYDKYRADCIIGEVNNGGDLVESNVRALRKDINFQQVRATRGKVKRAEPIAALYEQGKVFHLSKFTELEEQMTTYTGQEGEKSPDRLDALVWALTELLDSSVEPSYRVL